jgi:serine/threonine protein kinase
MNENLVLVCIAATFLLGIAYWYMRESGNGIVLDFGLDVHSGKSSVDGVSVPHAPTFLPKEHPRVVFLENYTGRGKNKVLTILPMSGNVNIQVNTSYILPFEKPFFEECTEMKPWQSRFHTTCNILHEIDTSDESMSLIAMNGFWRSVWKYKFGSDNVALKMLHIHREFNEESFSHHKVDAIAMDRLTRSNFVILSYGFCAQSTLVELAPHDAHSYVKNNSLSPLARLRIARDLAQGLNHIHSTDYAAGNNVTLIHNDINIANLVILDNDIMKFNDFNIAVMLRWNKTKPCGVPVQYRGDLWRSPEEIRNETYVSEKIDVYALGNILFQVLTRHQPWTWIEPDGPLSIELIAKKKQEGLMPTFPKKIISSQKLTHLALYFGALACFHFDPDKRPTAFHLAQGFDKVLSWIQKKRRKSKDDIIALFSNFSR